ncbi:VCBS repeat-containing protein [bacterium]|nr:VCBS repeat-containing protein [bacterium]
MTNPRKLLINHPGIAALISLAIFITCIITLTGCGTDKDSEPVSISTSKIVPAIKTAAPAVEGSMLFLSQAQFIKKTDPKTGKEVPSPGPARLSIWTKTADGWLEEILEDADSDVFHKAAWFKPVQGKPGILTIGAREAHLKLWRKDLKGVYKAESLWNPTFGGKNDRLRDFEIADVNDDGLNEICVATHDEGVVAVLRWLGGRYTAEELTRRPNTFVHEIEVGDVDGDGIAEMFSTPSNPNKMDGSVQPGGIDMFQWENNQWVQSQVEYLEHRHAKEILCAQLTDMSRPVLFTALEGEKIGAEQAGDTTKIRMYEFNGGTTIKKTDIASLPGHLCRFLCMGDTDGDGKNELIASTNKNGIWRLDPTDTDSWKKTLIATGTSGFEHSTYLADLNDDGLDEIYVASDNQRQLRCYAWNGRGYTVTVIGPLKDDTITFNVVAAKP